ncbi:hypothetical protein QUB05_09400 [Microcoleus sp. F10-C6]|uniref:hypothetical protein n=1 Tax=unclassified Microcoleus TaxID=2642155 RepID=UPI002FD4BDF8
MDSTNQFSQELEQDCAVLQQQLPANPVAEELNELELDAIAGGLGFMFQDWHNIPRFSPRNYDAFAGKKVGDQATFIGVVSIDFGNKFH